MSDTKQEKKRFITIPCTQDEYDKIDKMAKSEGLAKATYIRRKALGYDRNI